MSRRIAALGVVISIVSACGGAVPTTPTPTTGMMLLCSASTILAGDLATCAASLATSNVSTAAVWASSDPSITTSQGLGLFLGKSEGQATVTATYSGLRASVPLTVHLQDVLRVTASADQGTLKVGTPETLWLQGGYGVASADSGTLTLVVMDQTGATINTSAPLVVPHGGDRYIISTTFTLPSGTTRVCRRAVLQIGSTTLTTVPDPSVVPCLPVAQ